MNYNHLSKKEYKRSRDEFDYIDYSNGLSKRHNTMMDGLDEESHMSDFVNINSGVHTYDSMKFEKRYDRESLSPNLFSTPPKKFGCRVSQCDYTSRGVRYKEKMSLSKYSESSKKVYPNPSEVDSRSVAPSKIESETYFRIVNSHISTSGLVGLINMGNTCFMNAILQCLLHCSEMVQYFTRTFDENKIYRESRFKGALVMSFAQLYNIFYHKDNHLLRIKPTKMKQAISQLSDQFDGCEQQDAHELLCFLLDGLNDELKSPSETMNFRSLSEHEIQSLPAKIQAEHYWSRHHTLNASFITDIFCGQFRSTVTCKVCHHQSYCFDPFYNLSIPLPNDALGRTIRRMKHNTSHQADCSLYDCLDRFVDDETLSIHDKTDCMFCKKKQECSKSLKIEKAPRVLVLHLKRFNNARKKKNHYLSFPITNLNISRYLSEDAESGMLKPAIYDLFAVCHHSGTLSSGHYVTSCLEHDNSCSWHTFDDAIVSKLSHLMSPCKSPYILFYKQR